MFKIIHHWPKGLNDTVMPTKFKNRKDAIEAAVNYTRVEYEQPYQLGHHSYEIVEVMDCIVGKYLGVHIFQNEKGFYWKEDEYYNDIVDCQDAIDAWKYKTDWKACEIVEE